MEVAFVKGKEREKQQQFLSKGRIVAWTEMGAEIRIGFILPAQISSPILLSDEKSTGHFQTDASKGGCLFLRVRDFQLIEQPDKGILTVKACVRQPALFLLPFR